MGWVYTDDSFRGYGDGGSMGIIGGNSAPRGGGGGGGGGGGRDLHLDDGMAPMSLRYRPTETAVAERGEDEEIAESEGGDGWRSAPRKRHRALAFLFPSLRLQVSFLTLLIRLYLYCTNDLINQKTTAARDQGGDRAGRVLATFCVVVLRQGEMR